MTQPIVLSVEDFEPARFIRTRVLREAGFEVIEAASADEAMRLARKSPPQLALIDIHLPDLDGFELCRTLTTGDPSLPVVLISAVDVTAWARETAVAAGAVDFLPEPIKPKELVRRLQVAIEPPNEEPALHWCVTDMQGIIFDGSAALGELLHTHPTQLRGRSLILFFIKDRATWQKSVEVASRGHLVHREALLRPRERRTVAVDVELSGDVATQTVQWVFSDIREASQL